MIRARLLFALAVLLGTAVLAHRIEPAVGDDPDPVRARAVPSRIAGWQGIDEPVSGRVFLILETQDVIVRRYRRDRQEAVLAIAASSSDRKVAHPPEVCLRASGYEVARRENVAVPGLPEGAIRLLARRGNSVEQVLYWYVVNGESTASYLGHQLDALLGRISGRDSGAALVRISTERPGEEAFAELLRFAADAVPEIERAFGDVEIAGHRSEM